MDVQKVRLLDHCITLSIGIAYQNVEDDYMRLFKKADEAVYTAKQKGRNQIYTYYKK